MIILVNLFLFITSSNIISVIIIAKIHNVKLANNNYTTYPYITIYTYYFYVIILYKDAKREYLGG